MRKTKTCFCEVGFLTEFINSHPTILEPNDDIIKLMGNWISMYQFICKSNVVLDISASRFSQIKESNEWMKMFWKKSSNGECNIDFSDPGDFPYISDLLNRKRNIKELNAVYLTTQPDNICRKLSEELGIVILNNDLVRSCSHLYIDNGTEFPSDNAKDWDFLRRLNSVYPAVNICNSMIIVDNFLFTDDLKNGDDEKFEYNLKPILKTLLPHYLSNDEVFEIAIFTGEDKDRNFGRQMNYIRSLITRIRPSLKVRLCFYGKSQSMFHDRAILTNNLWISSGHGFDIFGKTKDVGKPTTVSIAFPFLQNKLLWCDGSYLNIIRQAQNISQNRLIEPDINYWGDAERTNRIIQYFGRTNNKSEIAQTPDISQGVYQPNMKIDLTKIPDYSKWGKSRFNK